MHYTIYHLYTHMFVGFDSEFGRQDFGIGYHRLLWCGKLVSDSRIGAGGNSD